MKNSAKVSKEVKAKSTNKSNPSKTIKMKKEASTAAEVTETVEATAPKARGRKAGAPKAEKVAKPVVNFISAIYGADGATIEVKDNMRLGRKITNKLAGSDPAPKVKKSLQVIAEIDGERIERTFAEGEILKF